MSRCDGTLFFDSPLDQVTANPEQYETLRLYGSIVFIPKSTGFHTQSVTVDERTHVLPPSTSVNINVQALHTEPEIWGPDALEWKPSRWLEPSNSSHSQAGNLTAETFIEPEAGSFIPWADGPRACVGKKFSQVEFVAVLAVLFQQYQARPVLKAGESEEDGKRALIAMVNNSAISAITLQMQEPRSRALRWEKRSQKG
jgi:cytochrome P450